MSTVAGYGGGFALIVVLFILLIIVGATWATPGYGAAHAPCGGFGYGYGGF